MPQIRIAFTLGLLAWSAIAAAADDTAAVARITGVSSPRLSLYARDAADSKLKDVARDSVPMPLDVSETAPGGGFFKVKIAGDTVWVSKKQVSLQLAVSSGCLAQTNATTDAGTIRGANRGCSK